MLRVQPSAAVRQAGNLSAIQVQTIDLHCDAEATLHLYGLTPQRQLALGLGALPGTELSLP